MVSEQLIDEVKNDEGTRYIRYYSTCIVLILYEWPKMEQNQKKEKKIFLAFLTFDWVFAIVLLVYPDLPNPLIPLIPIFEWIKK